MLHFVAVSNWCQPKERQSESGFISDILHVVLVFEWYCNCFGPGNIASYLCLTRAGSEALNVFSSFQLPPPEEANHESVLQKFEEACTQNKTETYKINAFFY